ncbi:RNA pseudouridylate synthase domain-containing protein 1 [Pogona vitticeps]
MEPVSLDNLSILYQSPNFIVVNKHWDVRIDSKMWYEKLTLQSQLKYHFPELADPDTYYGFRFCHQLDFSTSGALCVALNKAAAGSAYKCFKERRVTKAYLALVRGHVQEGKMTIRYAVGKNMTEGLTHMMCIEGTEGCENPKPCQSELTVLERGLYSGDPVTKVLLQPLTGRTHQLRVHCSAIGHPIVGDFTYSFKKDGGPYRMMLHAYYLRIPTTKELIEVSAPDPFVPTLDSNWSPQEAVRQLDELIQELKDESVQAEEEGRPAEDGAGSPDLETPPRAKSPEAKESQGKCEEWLAEWSLE